MKTQPQLPNDFERMVPEYHNHTITYGEHVARYQAAKEYVRGKRVLDIACGSGYGSKILAEAAASVVGVDVAEDAVAYASHYFSTKNASFKVGDGVSIPLGDASVDVVISFETIEHIQDYERFLDEVKRVLTPGGLLLLSTPNDLEFAEGNHFHVHEFKYDELKGVLAKRFKNLSSFFQGTWIYTGVFDMGGTTKPWDASIRTIQAAPLTQDKVLYFFMVCSDHALSANVKPLGVISEHWSARSLQQKEGLTQDHVGNLQAVADDRLTYVHKLEDDLKAVNAQLAHVTGQLAHVTGTFGYRAHLRLRRLVGRG